MHLNIRVKDLFHRRAVALKHAIIQLDHRLKPVELQGKCPHSRNKVQLHVVRFTPRERFKNARCLTCN